MKTQIFTGDLSGAAEMIRRGGLVAVPTETVYGLAGNGMNEKAVRDIYEVKGRPAIKPLSLMVPGAEAMEKYCLEVPEQAKLLAGAFWPGPLTIVMKARPEIPEIVLAGGSTVGLRCPAHEKTLELLRMLEVPLAVPSANPSGMPSPKNAGTVREYFDGKIEGIIDGGECGIGMESTLISLCSSPYRILRQGALSAESIADCLVSGMTVIGITGGSGAGKTSVLSELEKSGFSVIDCDRLYHELLETDAELISELSALFPGTVIDGRLDRKKLGTMVFGDEAKLKLLNSVSHRYVCNAVRNRLRELAMNGCTKAALDALYIVDSPLAEFCTHTVGVLASKEVRLERIMKRDGISREYALARLNAQKPDSFYIDSCTKTIRNDGDLAGLSVQIKELLKEMEKVHE